MEERIARRVVKGRDFGGLGILTKLSSISGVKIVKVDSSRLLAINFLLRERLYSLLNVHLPDNTRRDASAEVEYLEQLPLAPTRLCGIQ